MYVYVCMHRAKEKFLSSSVYVCDVYACMHVYVYIIWMFTCIDSSLFNSYLLAITPVEQHLLICY